LSSGVFRFRIQDVRFKIQDSRFKIQDAGFRVQQSGMNHVHGAKRIAEMQIT
jgi:hypothetical protein